MPPPKFHAGDVVRLSGDWIASGQWSRELIEGVMLIRNVLFPGHINPRKVECYVESLEHPEVSLSEGWFFWESELELDPFLTAVRKRREL